MSMPYRRVAAVLALVALGGASQGANANNLNFLKQAPLAYFTEADVDQARGALGRALRSEAMEVAFTWSNPATRAGGTITPLRTLELDGRSCRELRVENRHPKARAQGRYTLCLREGRWVLAPTR